MLKNILFCLITLPAWTQAETYILSHFTFKNGDWNTFLSLQNGSSSEQEIDLIVYDNQGETIGETTWQLAANATLVGSLDTLIPFAAEVGWLSMHAQTDLLYGIAKFSFLDKGTSSLGLTKVTDTGIVFPLIENNQNWQSGFAAVNTSDQSASLLVELIQPDGQIVDTVFRSLAAREKLVTMAADLFEVQTPAQAIIRIKSTQQIAGFALSFYTGNDQIVAVPGLPFNYEVALPDGMSPDAPIETLQLTFMLGQWDVDASWPIGGGVRNEGNGPVTCYFAEDGITLRRDWDVFMNSGAHVLGFDTHHYDVDIQAWRAEWKPANADTAPSRFIVGNIEEGTYVEIHTGVDGFGKPYTAYTRFFDVTESSYEVQTDWQYNDGTMAISTWRASFKRAE